MAKRPIKDMPMQERAAHYVSNALISGLIRLARALPYHIRVPLIGAVMANVLGPLVGYRRRAVKHLAHVFPEMSQAKRMEIAKACLNNTGRTLIENYSNPDMMARMKDQEITGPGLAAMKQAHADGRPTLLVTGHFGNYETTRAALNSQGFPVGALYRNMSNPYFNPHYVKTMVDLGGPMFPQGHAGTKGFVKHLRAGGQLVLLFDQHVFNAPVLDFVGKPARTALSAAELALRFNAVLIPFYGIRQPDGLTFETVLETPIAHSDATTMTQAMNDSLSARIRENPGQWLWVHRRWRPDDA
jgi:KDO2-lipid IV(A) lauroyltransferase